MDRLTSMGISNEGQAFLKAASILRTQTSHLFTPTYFAICQSIELSLKAFLRGCGYSEPLLRKLGHDLLITLSHAQKLGLGNFCELSDLDVFALTKINPYYKGKDLQYSKTGFKSYPEIDILMDVGNRLWSGTRKFCEENRSVHTGKDSEVS